MVDEDEEQGSESNRAKNEMMTPNDNNARNTIVIPTTITTTTTTWPVTPERLRLSPGHPGVLGKRNSLCPSSTSHLDSDAMRSTKRAKTSGASKTCTPTTMPRSTTPGSSPSALAAPPTGPRALTTSKKLICFYWYHKGRCTPRRKNKRWTRCPYAHTLDVPSPQVSLPPGMGDHVGCELALCPVNAAAMPKRDDVLSKRVDEVSRRRKHRGGTNQTQGTGSLGKSRSKAGKRKVEATLVDDGDDGDDDSDGGYGGSGHGGSGYGGSGHGGKQVWTRQVQEQKEMRRRKRQDLKEKRLVEDMDWAMSSSKDSHPRVLVHYDLPMGEDRLDWDTDRVRRLFEEIE
ncbi:hypothetical protein ACEQ8H_008036 [Pleosporales sp. CAS-2024a]